MTRGLKCYLQSHSSLLTRLTGLTSSSSTLQLVQPIVSLVPQAIWLDSWSARSLTPQPPLFQDRPANGQGLFPRVVQTSLSQQAGLATTAKEDEKTVPKHSEQSRTANASFKTGVQAFHDSGWTREAVMNVPNAISMARLISGPFVAYLILDEHWAAALGLLAVAGASDWADGYAAKHYGQSSVLGSYLDPLADKVLVCCTVGALAQQGSLPMALAGIIIGRDVLLVTGAVVDRVRKVGGKRVGDFFSALGASPFGGILSTLGADRDLANLRPIPINVTETDKSFEITADIPGVDRGDIDLVVDGDVLRIAVTQEDVKEEPGVRVERTRRFVERRIRLPDSADTSKITAAYDNGVLKVTVPKREGAGRQQTIDVGGPSTTDGTGATGGSGGTGGT
ncbi:hypothetical protein WJX75_007126 [Coccomyxa subellipsoidea]|uniref:SHSP domain-containing protein n=1 Tax=Coccomyxa subellipsoidea TaxID=248742 RepID=A0ABR2YI49_9CHLO